VIDRRGQTPGVQMDTGELQARVPGGPPARRAAGAPAVIGAERSRVSGQDTTGVCLGSRPSRGGGYQIGMRKLPAKGCKID
jgi:hypothetical protein